MSMINVAATVSVTEAEGPGKRFAVWVQGCPMRCPGCCNPQYLEFNASNPTSVDDLHAQILEHAAEVEGVTFVGGEPFSQANPLAALAERVRADGLSVMVFSGFTRAQLEDPGHLDHAGRLALLGQTDLLVDGPYLRELHTESRRWIGSTNQEVHFLTDRYTHLREEWDPSRNTIEIRLKDGAITINGFPHPDITRLSRRRK